MGYTRTQMSLPGITEVEISNFLEIAEIAGLTLLKI
jgi:hypothetical protein